MQVVRWTLNCSATQPCAAGSRRLRRRHAQSLGRGGDAELIDMNRQVMEVESMAGILVKLPKDKA